MISLYADGSSCGRILGPGGWAWVALEGNHPLACDSGGAPEATNNQMELTGVLQAMLWAQEWVRAERAIEVVSDSMYALGMANGNYTPHKNIELARLVRKTYVTLHKGRALCTRWVPGHEGEVWNERVDGLAKEAKESFRGRKT